MTYFWVSSMFLGLRTHIIFSFYHLPVQTKSRCTAFRFVLVIHFDVGFSVSQIFSA
jgi:hypothetical protein